MKRYKQGGRHSVYISELDAEHRTLFRIGEELHRAVVAKAGPGPVGEVVRALLAHVEDHFTHEERLMRRSGYPAIDWHKRQHDGVRRHLKRYAKRVESGDIEAATLLLDYLSSWLNGHTGLTDRMMAAYLRNYDRHKAAAAS